MSSAPVAPSRGSHVLPTRLEWLGVACCIFLAVVSLLGCQSRRGQTDRAQAKVAAVENDLRKNGDDLTRKAAVFTAGVGDALAAETNRTPAVLLAYDLNQRAAALLPAPDYSELRLMQTAVEGMLSQVEARQKAAEDLLRKLDVTVGRLQAERGKLDGKLDQAEQKRDDLMDRMASEADFGRKVKRWLWWGVGGVAFLFVAPILFQGLSLAFPAFAPITALLAGIVAAPGKLLVKAVPAAADSMGVVARSQFDQTRRTALDLVSVIQDVKARDRATYESVLKPRLVNATDAEGSRRVIEELKRQARPIS